MNDFFDIINNSDINISRYINVFNAIYEEVKKVLNITQELELALTITTEEEQFKLNRMYRGKHYIADVLTFALEDEGFIPADDGVRHLGDIFICFDQAIRQAKMYNHSLKRELAFLFVHGMLHILGYDHIVKTEEAEMFRIQNQILGNLNILRTK